MIFFLPGVHAWRAAVSSLESLLFSESCHQCLCLGQVPQETLGTVHLPGDLSRVGHTSWVIDRLPHLSWTSLLSLLLSAPPPLTKSSACCSDLAPTSLCLNYVSRLGPSKAQPFSHIPLPRSSLASIFSTLMKRPMQVDAVYDFSFLWPHSSRLCRSGGFGIYSSWSHLLHPVPGLQICSSLGLAGLMVHLPPPACAALPET